MLYSLILVFSLFALAPLYAAETSEAPIGLKSDKLYFDEHSGLLTANGSVEVTLDGLTVEADSLIVNIKKDLVSAEGNVLIRRGEYSARVSSLTYRADSKVTYIKDFNSVIAPKGIDGYVFLHSKSLEDMESIKKGSDGSSTTCDYRTPHYHARASRFEYYPGDKVVGFGVTLYIGNVPVMWLPYYVYDIKKHRVSMLFPIVGRNDVEGDFIKTSTEYLWNGPNWGTIYLDLMAKKGWGRGIEHNYVLGALGLGSVYLYNVLEQDTKIEDWVFKLNHTIALTPTSELKIKEEILNTYFIPSGRLDQTRSEISYNSQNGNQRIDAGYSAFQNRIQRFSQSSFKLGYSRPQWRSNYQFNEQFSQGGTRSTTRSHGLSHNMPFLLPNSQLSINSTYFQSTAPEGSPANERIESSIVLDQSTALYNLRMTNQWFLDPDGDSYTLDRFEDYIERMPDIQINFRSVTVASMEVTPRASFGTFKESRFIPQNNASRVFSTHRYQTGFRAARTFPTLLSTNFFGAVEMDQYWYDPGDQRYAVTESLQANTQLGGFIYNNASFQRGFAEGNSPFFFDNRGNIFSLARNLLTFSRDRSASWSFEYGYNYITNEPLDIISTLTLRRDPTYQTTFKGGFDTRKGIYRDLVLSALFTPASWLMSDVRSSYDLNRGKLTSATHQLDFTLGDQWQNRWTIRIGQLYDISRDQFRIQDLYIMKDLHCWEMKLSYSEFRQEWRVAFTIKAFPESTVGFSTGSEGVFFESLKKQSPVRY